MQRSLRVLLGVAGGVAVLAGAHDVARGVRGVRGRGSGVIDASVDSEMRFFATWYAIAGLFMLRAARSEEPDRATVRLISVGWLMAGVSRGLSMRAAGRPHGIYVGLMVAELAVSAMLLRWQTAVERLKANHA